MEGGGGEVKLSWIHHIKSCWQTDWNQQHMLCNLKRSKSPDYIWLICSAHRGFAHWSDGGLAIVHVPGDFLSGCCSHAWSNFNKIQTISIFQYARETDSLLAVQRREGRQRLFTIYPDIQVGITNSQRQLLTYFTPVGLWKEIKEKVKNWSWKIKI